MEKQSLNFDSKADNIVIAEKLIDDVCKKFSVNEDYYGNILIAVTEAVNNAINHGNRQNPEKKVHLGFATEKKSLRFMVKDEGDGFDYENLPDPTDPANLEKISGRGVFLMRNLADEVEFSENGTQVEMIFNVE
ncbi:MAG: ATP-binding protein [Flavobacteriales bacterium]|jgi:serine/threonine-protein kinase RsbW|nr:ATP-binding protein [Flavobacteriales bacterium]